MSLESLLSSRSSHKVGCGDLFNSLLSSLPLELHVLGYNYLGPGTDLGGRLCRGVSPSNKLDKFAFNHDIWYTKYPDLAQRHIADKIVQQKAWQRVTLKDAGLLERAVALATSAAMALK